MKINGIGILSEQEQKCLIPLEQSENGLFTSGKDGVTGIYSTLDKKLQLIEFEDKTLTYVKSSAGHPAIYELKQPEFQAPAKAVLMDLDGTSVRSESFWIWIIEQVTQYMLGDKNFRFESEDLPHVSGYSVTEHLSYCIRKYSPKTPLAEAVDKYFEITEYEMNEIMQGRGKPGAFTPAPDLKEFLYTLKDNGVKIGLVTSGLYQKAWPEILNAFTTLDMGDPVDFYDAIITAGTAIRKGQAGTLGEIEAKPHPWLYAETAMGLGEKDKSRIIGIEDSAAGVMSIRLAGYAALGVADGNLGPSGMLPFLYNKRENESLMSLISIILGQ
ncbi:MAG: HAD family phosphatase [Ruminococcaceae bacterium]|nr:HAD family phosphatase [Oscillospiraceae bacterium]